MKAFRLTLIITAMIAMALVSRAATIYVDSAAVGPTYDGTSWGNAFNSLQDGLTVATAGDSVLVAKGTYTPHASLRTEYFNLKEGVVMIGSLAGNETEITSVVLENRDLEANASILSGDLNGDDAGFSNREENSYHVLYARATASSITSTCQVDGFVITGGNANHNGGTNFDHMRGGGIYLEATIPYTVSPGFRNIQVIRNSAQQGGGVFISALTSATCSPFFENFDISHNRANEATDTQLTSAAGISITASAGTASPVFQSGAITHNIVTTASGAGGGVLLSAAESAGTAVSNPEFTSVYFCSNLAEGGGSHISMQSDGDMSEAIPVFTNVTIAGASASSAVSNSVAPGEASTCTPQFINTIIYTTYPVSISNVPHASTTPNPQISYSNIYGSILLDEWYTAIGTDGGGNIDEDPELVDTTHCDFRLYNTSPSIGTGDGVNNENMGWYAGEGAQYLDIEDLVDVAECNGDTLYVFRMAIDDEASENAVYQLELGGGNLELSHITEIQTADTLTLEIRIPNTWTGSDTIEIRFSNDVGEKDSTDFTFSLDQRPYAPGWGYGLFNTADSTYRIAVYEDTTLMGEQYVFDGVLSSNNYYEGVEPGQHYALLEKAGCYSDTTFIELDSYLNDITLSIESYESPDITLCGGDTTLHFEFYFLDDRQEQIDWMFNYHYLDVIPQDNITLTETDTSYIFEVIVPDTTGFYQLHIHAENIYYELANLYWGITILNSPTIDSVPAEEGSPGYFCIYPGFSGVAYGYLAELYLDGEQVVGAWPPVCGLSYGAHSLQINYDGCWSAPYAFTIEEPGNGTDALLSARSRQVSVYPIPATEYIHIDGVDKEAHVRIYSITGEAVQQGVVEANNRFALDKLNAGLYLLELQVGNLREIIRFIVE